MMDQEYLGLNRDKNGAGKGRGLSARKSSEKTDANKRKGYQEARRQARDRRDRRNERLGNSSEPRKSSLDVNLLETVSPRDLSDGSDKVVEISDDCQTDKGEGSDSGKCEDATHVEKTNDSKPTEKLFLSAKLGGSGSVVAKGDDENGDKPKLDRKMFSASALEEQWQKEEEERQKEKEQEELERKARAEEEADRERVRKLLEEYIQSTKEAMDHKLALRAKNSCAAENYPDDSFFYKLDSSLKKNTAFVKKVRNITEAQRDALSKDFSSLNLTKYIGEVAAGFTEAKLKMSDVGCALHLCSLAHQRYPDFSPALLESWQKVLLTKKDEKVPNPSKYRVDLRFFADLITVGVFTQKEGLPLLANQLFLLTTNDKEQHNNVSIIISFCKHCGDEYAGLIPSKFKQLAEKFDMSIPRSTALPEERKKGCGKLLKEYYGSLCEHLLTEHKAFKNVERQNKKILQSKGELSQDKKESYEATHQSFQKLLQNTKNLADLLEEIVPELPIEKLETEDEMMGIDIYSHDTEFEYDGENTLFEDEDTRQFYENLPDLKALVPQILYKDSEHTGKSEHVIQDLPEENDAVDVEDIEKEMAEQVSEPAEEEPAPAVALEDDDFDIAASMKQILEAFLNGLPTCVNRDLIDKAAIDFCMNLNTRSNRKKLVKTLFTVPRTRYDLLPFYSRFVATLNPCMPEVASDLVVLLKGDFKWHVRKKDQINIESKLKTVRFIAEMVKFKMFPKPEALHCLKMLLFDFKHHNIEMACGLLEACGRFLYRSLDSHHRTKVYLEVMMRKKAVTHMDQRYNTLIENAFYYCNPPQAKKVEVKVRPPMHEYIRKLLYKELSKITTEKILRQLRKLDWDNDDIAFYATKSLTAIWNVRFNVIHCCANLLAGLAPYHEKVAVAVVDGVIEDIRLGQEINHPKYNQRRVSTVKYLGELYNYRLVESSVVFKTLYSLITHGVTLNAEILNPMDPPEHLFRVRLVCVLLETCGQYFDRGSSKKKLDCFLSYFQRYYWFKRMHPVWTATKPFPVEMEYCYRDILETLRPKLKPCQSFEDASEKVDQLEKEFRENLNYLQKSDGDAEFEPQSEDTDAVLTTIQETEEMDELSQGISQVLTGGETSSFSPSQGSDTGGTGTNSQDQGHDDMGVDDEEDESRDELSLDSSQNSDSEDSVSVLTGGPKLITCQEDEDFMVTFDKMLTDTISSRMQENTKVPQLDIAVPMQVKNQKAKYFVPGEPEVEQVEANKINFVLMTRKGNKQHFSNLNVPVSEKFAADYKERELAEKQEKERLKKVVLNIHERQEEEDYQELISSISRPTVTSFTRREPKPKQYQHPKGAPDAALIFGSK